MDDPVRPIAALALARGLSDVVESTRGNVRLDTIFIDQGFGSLDAGSDCGTSSRSLRPCNCRPKPRSGTYLARPALPAGHTQRVLDHQDGLWQSHRIALIDFAHAQCIRHDRANVAVNPPHAVWMKRDVEQRRI